ncbi:MAG: DNA polymerase III subunit delta [Bauldia sp.]|nr:DNA polymerase III subunit delta [Bauldia sp.]
MVQVKPADADRLLAKPDPAVRVVLIYGSDDGLVAERAERFARAVTGDAADPIARLRLESAELADDPGRLADEAHAVPLFGGNRVISVRVGGNRPIQPAVETILAAPPQDSWVVLTAGELRKTAPLRKVCETNKGAWAIPCYADADRDLDRIIDEETKIAGLTISSEARTALKGLIGSDRMISRSEVRKLCLYAAGGDGITIDDVRAVIGDAAAFAVDETIDALAAGDSAALDRGYRRLVSSGTPGFVIAGAALRHFNFLQKSRAAFDGGRPPESLVQRAVPPIFFSRQAAVAKQIAAWPPGRIERTLAMLDQSMLDSRLHGALSDEVIGQTLQLVATLAAGGRRS